MLRNRASGQGRGSTRRRWSRDPPCGPGLRRSASMSGSGTGDKAAVAPRPSGLGRLAPGSPCAMPCRHRSEAFAGLPAERCRRVGRASEHQSSAMKSHCRACGPPTVARPRAPRRGAAQHDPDPVERAAARHRRRPAAAATDLDIEVTETRARRRGASRRDHRAGPRDLRHRAQAARGRAGLAGDRRRIRPDDDPLGPLALRARRAAGGRFSRIWRPASCRTASASRRPTSSG